MLSQIQRWTSAVSRGEDGASAVEYGLLVAGLAALVVLIVFAFGGVIKGVFKSTCSTVSNSTASGSASSSCQG